MHNSNDKRTGPTIVPYSFSTHLLNDMGFHDHEEPSSKDGISTEDHLESEQQKMISDIEKQADQMIEDAKLKAAEIIEEAEVEAARIRAEEHGIGYQEGFELGKKEGQETAYKETEEQLREETEAFLIGLKDSISEFNQKKEELLKDYSHELCHLALTIAEKVIKVSLKSSTEVITKMILAATEKSKNKEWARIHISNYDAELMVNGEADILMAVQQISPHVKVVIMENEQPGTCIIEFPDQIIDASVNTQLENIKELIDDHMFDGGV